MTLIHESLALASGAKPAKGPGRITIKIIDEGQGSSGYYPAETLKAAAADRIFKAGTHMYVDHPSATEAFERPERSVKDLAAVLASDARYEGGALVAEAKVFPLWAATIGAMAEDIGVSIRASAEVKEADGQRTITRITQAKSIDFVTMAGRGGRILTVHESARPVQEARNIGAWLEARLHTMFTELADDSYGEGRLTRAERITLSGALGEALAAFTSRVEADAGHLFQRDIWEEPEDSPPAPAGVTENRKEPSVGTIQIEEAELTALKNTSSRVAELEEANKALREEANRAAAEAILAEAFDGITAPKARALLLRTMPLTESGTLDAKAFRTEAAEAAAELRESAGEGHVTGAGHTKAPSEKIGNEDILAALEGGSR